MLLILCNVSALFSGDLRLFIFMWKCVRFISYVSRLRSLVFILCRCSAVHNFIVQNIHSYRVLTRSSRRVCRVILPGCQSDVNDICSESICPVPVLGKGPDMLLCWKCILSQCSNTCSQSSRMATKCTVIFATGSSHSVMKHFRLKNVWQRWDLFENLAKECKYKLASLECFTMSLERLRCLKKRKTLPTAWICFHFRSVTADPYRYTTLHCCQPQAKFNREFGVVFVCWSQRSLYFLSHALR